MSIPHNGLSNAASRLYHQVLNVPYPETEEDKLVSSIKAAHNDWQRAEAMFHEATDPDLIDHAIYNTLAAKTRYIYLLKTAKNKEPQR